MLHIIITSYKEPEATIKAIKAFLQQKISTKYKIIVVDPFPGTANIIKEKFPKEYGKKIEFFLDPGEGKSYALNLILEKMYSKNTNDIIILTDGDVFVSKNSVKAILNAFKDKKAGCVTGKPVSLDPRKKMFGYWSHVVFAGVDRVRKKLSEQEKFFECSGYLFAIRNGVLQGFPLETSEDSIIPYLFWKKGYKVKYVPEAEVYVLNSYSWQTWKKQKIRNIKAHENLCKIAPNMPRTKSFWNEIKEGTFFALTYPRNIREFFYTLLLFPARLYVYAKAFYDIKRKKRYADGWRGET
jgi:cellulose synthase/poly-beta-1,6-N-acetylglucosamine synthase-like glycosyltransferase